MSKIKCVLAQLGGMMKNFFCVSLTFLRQKYSWRLFHAALLCTIIFGGSYLDCTLQTAFHSDPLFCLCQLLLWILGKWLLQMYLQVSGTIKCALWKMYAADPVCWSFISFVQDEVVSSVIPLWINVDGVAVTFKLNQALCKPEEIFLSVKHNYTHFAETLFTIL